MSETITGARQTQGLWLALGVNFVWINASEVFRYFAFVMPMMREALAVVPDVAPMSVVIFLRWGLWDCLLVAVATLGAWMVLERFGPRISVAVLAGTCVWGAVFVIFWFGLSNMNLATGSILAVALPLAWVEMVVAALIVRWAMLRHR